MKEDHIMYQLTNTAQGAGSVIMKNTPYVVVEKAANMMAAQNPKTIVYPPNSEQKAESQKVEDFLRWSYGRWNKNWRRSKIQGSMQHAMAHFLCLRGWAAARVQYVGDVDEYDPRSHPVKIRLMDPLQVYPALGDDGLRYVVNRYWTTYGEASAEWDEAAKLFDDRDPNEPVEMTVYYDDWYWCVLSGNETVIKPTEHEYGFCPWVIVTGFGSPIRATDTTQTGWQAECGVSIFHGIRQSYKQLNKVLSQLSTQVENATNPAMIYYYDPATNTDPKPLALEPGSTNYMFYNNERVEPIQLSAKPSDMGPLIEALNDDIYRGSLPPILWGQGGTTSGFQTSVLTDAARDQLFPIISGMQEAMEQINEYALTLIRDLHEEPVGFWIQNDRGEVAGGITISPEDILAVGVENTVRFRDIAPKDKTTMAQTGIALNQAKLLSMETIRDEYLDIENPERENERILAESIFMDEEVVKQSLVPMALAATDQQMLAYWQQAQDRAAQAAMQQPAPGSGAPPAPGEMSGMPPSAVPPIMQPGANPMTQSLGSIVGGSGGGLPPGLPMPI